MGSGVRVVYPEASHCRRMIVTLYVVNNGNGRREIVVKGDRRIKHGFLPTTIHLNDFTRQLGYVIQTRLFHYSTLHTRRDAPNH